VRYQSPQNLHGGKGLLIKRTVLFKGGWGSVSNLQKEDETNQAGADSRPQFENDSLGRLGSQTKRRGAEAKIKNRGKNFPKTGAPFA